ncbi:MAG: FAD-dependent oxidoreductase [Planctomycetota bacterium]|nr:MAG: FAD-dependent oxidoreductase [Planctomycetota bacterium]
MNGRRDGDVGGHRSRGAGGRAARKPAPGILLRRRSMTGGPGHVVEGRHEVGAGVADQSWDVIVVGAGVAGLCAATELVRAGRRVLVVDKGRGSGGRMATRRLGAAVFDHGAQFFTVRSREFGDLVGAAEEAGAVTTWSDGFAHVAADGAIAPAGDGHPRWRGVRGMTDLPKHLLATLESAMTAGRAAVRTAARVTALDSEGACARVTIDAGTNSAEILDAGGLILTPPVPQSLDLLAAAGTVLEPETRRLLESMRYDPCFALMLVLDRPSLVPAPGAIQFDAAAAGPVAWLADNQQKGISVLPALTVHAGGRFSRDYFEAPPDEVMDLLVAAVRPWIDGDPATAVVERSLHRWKFALPTTVIPAPFVAVGTAPPIVCCGDAFAGPRVEGAASSGLAAGRWMAGALSP